MKFKVLLLLVVMITACNTPKVVVQQPTKKDPRVATTPSTKTVSTTPKATTSHTVTKGKNTTTQSYIDAYKEIAKYEMRQYAIPASITMAQGILESGNGNGRLAKEGNNHFGVKCHSDWTGERIYHDDDAKGECFRKYFRANESYRDHSIFLIERKRYFSLFQLPKDDYKAWAHGLKKAGYATDPKYPDKLISLIERYDLYELDAEVLGKTGKNLSKVEKPKDKHIVEKKDTLYSISRKYKISLDELKALNGLESNDIFIGQVLFVKPMKKDF